jgi:hypothetical protein
MDVYSVWIDSAMVYMKRNAKGAVLPKSLTVKLFRNLMNMTPNIEDNLFYSAINNVLLF